MNCRLSDSPLTDWRGDGFASILGCHMITPISSLDFLCGDSHRGWRLGSPLARALAITAVFAITAGLLRAQTTPRSVEQPLSQSIQPVAVTEYQLESYLDRRIPKLPSISDPAALKVWQDRLRRHILDDIAYHGWPREWVDAPPRFEEAGVIETGHGYRLHKLRYEVVPGFDSVAILYEPENVHGRAPAILNVIGHEPMGEAAEYEQKRCINFAKRGIIALSLGWMGFGELGTPLDQHDYAAHLDFVGANAMGIFYLAMRRGLDYLASRPDVDPQRLGMTGLSGGGWQTITLSALDERIAVAAEVAGFGSLQSNLTHPVDTDEIEENATDFVSGEDYPDLVILRAPRPTLLIHNAEDTCCFRAALVKPYIYEQIRPYFALFGDSGALAWHENLDPGTHNYQLDNRQQAYRFFTEHFHLPVTENEIPSDTEIRSPEELTVGLPPDNLTLNGLARKLSQSIARAPIPGGADERASWATTQREQLKNVIRYSPVRVENAWRIAATHHQGLETLSYRFDFSNGLGATGVWLKAVAAQPDAPATIVLDDRGRKAAGEVVSDRVNRGEQVLALDLLFNGATIPQEPDPADWEMLTASAGDRPLGIEVAQLLATTDWLRSAAGGGRVRLETDGKRNQVIALVAAALEPDAYSEIVSSDAIRSLGYLLDKPVPYRGAPELFCLDFYKFFDIPQLEAMAAPVEVNRIENARHAAGGDE
jgi:dienelactone hydrolase